MQLHTPDSLAQAFGELQFAIEHVPYFRGKGKELGFDRALDDPVAAFQSFPYTVKADYRLNFPDGILAEGRSLQDKFVFRSQSSGTGGDRLVSVATTYDLADRMAATLSANIPLRDALASCTGQRVARYAAPNCSDVECASPHTTMTDRVLPDGTLVLPVSHDLFGTSEAMVDQAISELMEWQPLWLYIDPTHTAFLLREMSRRGVAMPESIRGIAVTYTMLTKVARRQLEMAFAGLPSAEILSMSELGWLAVECPSGSLHLNNETFHLEAIRLPGSDMFELVVTSLGDELSPHIRYRTGDVYQTLSQGCACGHSFPAVVYEGRGRDFFTLGGTTLLTPRQIDDLVGEDPAIDVYRAHQLNEKTVLLEIMGNSGPEIEKSLEELEDRLMDRLGGAFSMRSRVVDYIPSARSGKFHSCASDVKAANE